MRKLTRAHIHSQGAAPPEREAFAAHLCVANRKNLELLERDDRREIGGW